ncbi:hypothetical protein OT109_09465 [Phycisphaeraceae bacterium D3-23]
MSFPDFIRELIEAGAVRVPPIDGPEGLPASPDVLAMVAPEERAEGVRVLAQYEQIVRVDWPLSPPGLEIDTALKTAVYFYIAARLVISRHVPAEVVEQLLDGPVTQDVRPGSHYAVDLVGRFLPDLVRLAGGALSDDPLVARLMRFAYDWPLSSVGVPGVTTEPERLAGLLNTPALRSAYVDRVLRLGDAGRLEDPAVAKAARSAVGPHRELVSAKLRGVLWPEPVSTRPTPAPNPRPTETNP